MRELKIGEQTVRVRATPLALLYYRQEFKSDLLGDLVKMQGSFTPQETNETEAEIDPTKLDTVYFLQLIWAMAKADAYGKPFPSFMEWLSSLDSFDFNDASVLAAALEEAASGFFRSGVKTGAEKSKPKGKRQA